jgi:hypothetical protein
MIKHAPPTAAAFFAWGTCMHIMAGLGAWTIMVVIAREEFGGQQKPPTHLPPKWTSLASCWHKIFLSVLCFLPAGSMIVLLYDAELYCMVPVGPTVRIRRCTNNNDHYSTLIIIICRASWIYTVDDGCSCCRYK